MLKTLCLFFLFVFVAQSFPVYAQSDNRDAERAAIRAHIESICQAFID
jgi:hypothetical protein